MANRQQSRAVARSGSLVKASSRVVAGVVAAGLCGPALAQWVSNGDDAPQIPHRMREPVTIQAQGSFFYGGKTITASGTFNPDKMRGVEGDIFPLDKGYVAFQIPPNARPLPLILWHGGGQTGKSWEDFDDRENYQSIFLRRGWSVYIIDGPKRGKAGVTSFDGPLGTILGQPVGPTTTIRLGMKGAFEVFRLGEWLPSGPKFFPGVQFPHTDEALEQFVSQSVPFYKDDFDLQADADAQVPLLNKVGAAILVTHSMAGGPGWYTAMRSSNVKAIVAYEPGSNPLQFMFPEGEDHPEGTATVPLSEFMKLTRIPIQMYYGDNIPKSGGNVFQQSWRRAVTIARTFAATINRHGGDAQVTELPEAGLKGNTHFPFGDLNNVQVADLMSQFLHDRGLDKRKSDPLQP